eukprot:gnl/MRDRNA2_/MRDRNA2_86531_c0_seq1.p2 gnl/MRDRNA2_/MRDRNA2_86531_c0~~gnl/MRDRNA2_/MRDRNA2_86531_c0_seq1.p2  ORF type:complete len:498 (-),score=9.34 gnl/MRDRNA2_/MRDRNA2_86531_c0_seq1:1570-3063(-)
MCDNIVEQIRNCHEELNYLEDQIVVELKNKNLEHHQKLSSALMVKQILSKIHDKAAQLKDIYRFSSRNLSDGKTTYSEHNLYAAFYSRLRDISEFYKSRTDIPSELSRNSFLALKENELDSYSVNFSDEEDFGRCLDLHGLYHDFRNSTFGTKCEYLDYLKNIALEVPLDVGKTHTETREYKIYLSKLTEYLEDFIERCMPFSSTSRMQSGLLRPVSVKDFKMQNYPHSVSEKVLNLSVFCSVEEMKIIRKENITQISYHLRGVLDKGITNRLHLLWKLHDHTIHNNQKLKNYLNDHSSRIKKDVALEECKIRQLSNELKHIKQNTVKRIETKMRKTYREIMAEFDDNKTFTTNQRAVNENLFDSNPLKLPNGPDDRPIPYWLYKLHGLNRKFECEICGYQIYEGRRAFEKHFQDVRHQQGMQALGLPNSKLFFEITRIKDAMKLWRSLNGRPKKDAQTIQEYEDLEGNVYDCETFKLLKKQGRYFARMASDITSFF